MLMHAAINNTKDIVPVAVAAATNPFALSTSRPAWLSLVLLWIAAGWFLVRMRGVTTLAESAAGDSRPTREDPVTPGRKSPRA
jgi:hypothetical protein